MNWTKLNQEIEKLKPGERMVVQHYPEALYHASPGIGSTLLKAATQSMAHFKAAREQDVDHSPQALKAMAIGSATHCMVLESEAYADRFVVQPDTIKMRKGKAWEEFQEEAGDREILTQADEDLASTMALAVLEGAGQFFLGGESEKSYWYRHTNGLILKARVDYQVGDAIIDLKTTRHENPEQFKKAVKYEYDMQDALYPLVTGLKDMIFVGVGKGKPHPVFLCKQGAQVREQAVKTMLATLEAIETAEEFEQFPNMPVELVETEFTPHELEKYCA